MKKSAFYLWWIGLLLLYGPLINAQHSHEDQRFQESKSSQDPQYQYAICLQKGNYFFDKEAYSHAIPYFEQALHIKRKEKKTDSIIQCLVNLSLVVAYDKQYERARAHLDEAAWYGRQQSARLQQITSQQLITQVNRTVNELESPPLANKQVESPCPHLEIADKIWYFFRYGASTGYVILFFLFGIYLITYQKRQVPPMEPLHIRHVLDYIGELYAREKAEKEAMINENKRLAGVMQDDLGNLITSVKMHIEQMEDAEEVGGHTGPALRKASRWLDEACIEMRGISRQLERNSFPKSSLIKKLRQYREYLLSAEDFESVTIHHHGFEAAMPFLEESIYRIIINWCRYLSLMQQGAILEIQVLKDSSGIHITIEDDGNMISFGESMSPEKNFLLGNVREWVATVGGKWEFDSSPLGGNMLSVSIPD
jgi:signal transduction histidine kinase